ncbi:MAG: CvpA family protein, partial [Candidatus Omnitrophica bacterium]|nr:CvpA family protein [Candidatus Omnitrophota bacterium]
ALHLLGLFLSIFIIFHYYPVIGNFLESKAFFKTTLANSAGFIILWILTALIAKLVRFGIYTVLRIEANSLFDKTGGLILAVLRGLLICSLVLWFMRTTASEYVIRNINSSFSSSKLVKIAPSVYQKIFDGFVVKYFPKEKINQDVLFHKKDSLKSKSAK